MYERLLNKTIEPSLDEFIDLMGSTKEFFIITNDYLVKEIQAGHKMKFDAHSRCWKIAYHLNRKYICDIIAEKDAFTVVSNLNKDMYKIIYDNVNTYAKDCMLNSPFFKIDCGWVAYRVTLAEHIKDAKTILNTRVIIKV